MITNQEYVNTFKNVTEENKLKVLEVLDSYGDNKWWLSEDLRVLAYYQIMEPVLVTDFAKFHEGLEKLLGRPVWTHELGVNIQGLRNEAEKAWNGIEVSDEDKQRAINIGFNKLFEVICEVIQ
jgi:hypothetical protein